MLAAYITEEDSSFFQPLSSKFNIWDEYKAFGRFKIPYIVSSTVDSETLASIEKASKQITLNTCVDFHRRENEKDYVEFTKEGHNCLSNMGRFGGEQVVYLGGGCNDEGMVEHQMMHVMGLWHEQSRYDRDDHVIVKLENVARENLHNFKKRSQSTTHGVYDVASILHADGFAFSMNGYPTIVDKHTGLAISGQREKLSAMDIMKINELYGCGNHTTQLSQSGDHWADWGNWLPCSSSCDRGERVRLRKCWNDEEREVWVGRCGEEHVNTKICQSKPCSAGAWGAWGSCSVTCGTGIRHRTACCHPHERYESQICGVLLCHAPDVVFDNTTSAWSLWEHWGECTRTCGSGFRKRTRHCDVNNRVVGEERCPRGIPRGDQVEFCSTETCGGVDEFANTWDAWEEWGECSLTCGDGKQSRSRACKEGGICFGDKVESRSCGEPCMPVGTWEEWSLWTNCPSSCEGTRWKERVCRYVENQIVTTCVGGTNSVGKQVERQKCRLEMCNTALYNEDSSVWSPWGQWGECSKSCGKGTQWRLRSCLKAEACSDVSTNGRICNTQSCDDDFDSDDDWETTTQPSTVAMTTPAPRWGGWVIVTNCSSSCGPGVVVLQRTCYNATYHLSENCFGVQATTENKSEPCEVEECPVWGLWSAWGECTGHCQQAFHSRSRSCATSCCDGPTMDIEECDLAECNVTKPAFNVSAVYTLVNTTLCTPGRFLTGDINADNVTDIVCVEDTGYLWSQLGLGNGSFSEVIFSERRVPQCPISLNANILLADMDGDGADDFVCHYSSHHYFQYLSLTDGKFAEVQTSFSINNYCISGLDMKILAGKLDEDSKDDFFCQYSKQPALNESVWYIQISN
uniref:A disintegrin and metalloproteinase with thrombospondin motifs adt-1-like isoform X1 n=2 Tax=Ciona intestinalis TaxID=7719 RepID=UPI000EF4A35D|nr:A disintegrin and metalloproteinase with thrombospondin motifs adt-1-like isoform X1 [Ciona intestinalis]|eukprot:XP_018669365.2 A disintegrin and metalloproteinase with thrombospondin motifs adt-1-like isoform X1 [Ciona intestinalis]